MDTRPKRGRFSDLGFARQRRQPYRRSSGRESDAMRHGLEGHASQRPQVRNPGGQECKARHGGSVALKVHPGHLVIGGESEGILSPSGINSILIQLAKRPTQRSLKSSAPPFFLGHRTEWFASRREPFTRTLPALEQIFLVPWTFVLVETHTRPLINFFLLSSNLATNTARAQVW